MHLSLVICAIAVGVALTGRAQGHKDSRLFGVWEMTFYARDSKAIDWTGMMIITPEHFSRIYMQKERPVFRDRYEKLSDLTEQEKNTIVEALVSNFGGASGKYSIDGDRLFFIPSFPANPGLKDCEPSRVFSLNQDGTQLTLKGMMSRGYEVEEIWVKREDLD